MLNDICGRVRFIAVLAVPLVLASAPQQKAEAAPATPLLAAATTEDIQNAAAHLEALKQFIENLEQTIEQNRPPGEQGEAGFDTLKLPGSILSSGGTNVMSIAKNAQKEKEFLENLANDPMEAHDLLSRLAGMTQSETSTAWCGRNALIGFNDSGSFLATLFVNTTPSPSFSFSFTGWAVSHDAGETFRDRGALVADPLPPRPPGVIQFRDLFGDPVVGCTDSSTFYFANLAEDTFLSFGPPFSFQIFSGISVSRSVDGGDNFGGAVMAVSKNGFSHFLDKPWMAVRPGATRASDTIQVTYTDFDISGFFGPNPCGRTFRTAIETARSTDGGATWSAPVVIDEVCGFAPAVQGSQVKAGLGSDVLVAWERYASFPAGARDIRIRRSTNGGASFGPASLVSPVKAIGNGFVLQGNFRAFIDLQGLAVDTSGGPNTGAVYVSWHDGRNASTRDVFGICPSFSPFGFCNAPRVYQFGDVLLTRSNDGGATFSAPVRVNNDPVTLLVDQFMPALAVGNDGSVFLAFYDRRADPRNFLIDTFLARSSDGGRFKNSRLTEQSFPAITGWQDILVNPFYMGDYISVAVDATGQNDGVIAAWGDNSLGDANVSFTKR